MSVLKHFSAVCCSAVDSHLKLLGQIWSSYDILTQLRSVAVLCMLFKIKSNPMHPLSRAFPLPYVLAHVTRGATVAHS